MPDPLLTADPLPSPRLPRAPRPYMTAMMVCMLRAHVASFRAACNAPCTSLDPSPCPGPCACRRPCSTDPTSRFFPSPCRRSTPCTTSNLATQTAPRCSTCRPETDTRRRPMMKTRRRRRMMAMMMKLDPFFLPHCFSHGGPGGGTSPNDRRSVRHLRAPQSKRKKEKNEKKKKGKKKKK